MWYQIFDLLFPSRGDAHARAEAASKLARFAVLGAFVLGVLPGAAEAFAQSQKAGAVADGGAKNAPAKSGGAKSEGAKSDSVKVENTKVNMAPIRAFLTRSKRLHEQGKLDLSKPKTVTVEGDRQEDGTLTNVRITGESAADPSVRRVADDFVASVNQSHALRFLEDVSHMRMTFVLDGERFRAETYSDMPSAEQAEQKARGYRMLLNVGRIAKRGTDEGALMSGMKVSSSGKQLVMNLDMPREQMGNLLLKQITPN